MISVVRCWGGERWLVGALEMRRKHPISGPSRLVPMRQPRITGAKWRVAKGAEAFGKPGDSKGPMETEGKEASSPAPGNTAAVDRLTSKQRGALKGQSTGGQAEQTYKHRARDAGDPAVSW